MKSISEGERQSLNTIIDGVRNLSDTDQLSLVCAFDKEKLEEVTLLVRLITKDDGTQNLIPLCVVRDSREICQRYALPNGQGGYDFDGRIFGSKRESLSPEGSAEGEGESAPAPENETAPPPGSEGPPEASSSLPKDPALEEATGEAPEQPSEEAETPESP